MNYRILTIVALMLSTRLARAEEVQQIPLDQIWAYKMPETRDIEKAAKQDDMRRLSSITESWFHRAGRLKFKDIARPGFAVPGSGREPLLAALAVFEEHKKAIPNEFLEGDEITIVFFSEPTGRLVRIQHVVRERTNVEIQYSIEPEVYGFRFNLALIPLGKLPVGEYQVAMCQLPRKLTSNEVKMGLKTFDEEWSRDFLCKPFVFTITENGESK
jgi:hypothetical protein